MKQSLFITVFFIFVMIPTAHADVWINEFHYDEAGSDTTEFVEIVMGAPEAPYRNDYFLNLYNGADGSVYQRISLGDFTGGDTVNEHAFYYYTGTAFSWLQNGAPDGMALEHNGAVVSNQYISYEGSFQGTGGPAHGYTFFDIGLSESSATPPGSSLALEGDGFSYDSFYWSCDNDPLSGRGATPGTLNHGQTLTVTPEPISSVLLLVGLGLITLKQKLST